MSVTADFQRAQINYQKALIALMETALNEVASAKNITLDDARAMAKAARVRIAEFKDQNSITTLSPKWEGMDPAERMWGGG